MFGGIQMSEVLFERDRYVFEAHTDFQGYEGMDEFRPGRGDVLVIDQTWQMPGVMPGWLSSVKVPLVGFEVGSARGCQPLAPGAASLRWTIKKRIRYRLPRPKGPWASKAEKKAAFAEYNEGKGSLKARWFLLPYVYHVGKSDRCGALPDFDWHPFEVEPGQTVRVKVWVDMRFGSIAYTVGGRPFGNWIGLNFGSLRLMDGNVRAWSNFWEKNGRYFPIRRLSATVSLERPEPEPGQSRRDKIAAAIYDTVRGRTIEGDKFRAISIADAVAAANAVMAAIEKEET
jgi:hypothetical protein